MGKKRKKKGREKLAGRFIFVSALSQFSGPDYFGAWNRLVTQESLVHVQGS